LKDNTVYTGRTALVHVRTKRFSHSRINLS